MESLLPGPGLVRGSKGNGDEGRGTAEKPSGTRPVTMLCVLAMKGDTEPAQVRAGDRGACVPGHHTSSSASM